MPLWNVNVLPPMVRVATAGPQFTVANLPWIVVVFLAHGALATARARAGWEDTAETPAIRAAPRIAAG